MIFVLAVAANAAIWPRMLKKNSPEATHWLMSYYQLKDGPDPAKLIGEKKDES